MSHDDAFAAFREKREQERQQAVKVTWRKVSPLTGGGWSGLGPDGRLIYVREPHAPRWDGAKYEYGIVEGAVRVNHGGARTIAEAKRRAEAALTIAIAESMITE